MIRALVAGIVACTLACCTTPQGLITQAPPKCFKMNVVITGENGSGLLVAPGVPVEIVVRSKQGRVLRTVASNSEGHASFEVCWQDDDPPWQVEAKLRIGPQFVGTLVSFFSYADTYCLTLPQHFGGHCGEWGTGPNSLLRDVNP